MNVYKSLKITVYFQIILSIFLVLIYNILAASIFPPDLSTNTPIPDILYILSSQILGFLFTAITLIMMYQVYSISEYLKFDISFSGIFLALSTLLLAVLLINLIDYLQKLIIPVYLMSSYLSSSQGLQSDYIQLAKMLTDIHPWMLYLVGALLPAVCEEFFFRGYLLQLCLRHFTKLQALVIVSSLFAVLHIQFIALLPLFVFGFLLGLLTLKTGRLSYAVLVHFLNNSITLYILTM